MFRCKIFILLLLYLITSCKVVEKNLDVHKEDSVNVSVKLDDDITEEKLSAKPKKVLITSGNVRDDVGNHLIYENFPYEKLKIKEVQNTKVIKQNTDLSEGRIVYKIPEKMKVRSTYKVLVRISKSKVMVSLYDSLSGNVMTSRIPITETMEVKLVDISPKDNKAFEIVDGNSGIQMIESGDTYTEWSWDVTPVRIGKSKLKIVVSVIRNSNKKDIVYEDSVDVERDVIVQTSFFFKKYWQVLMTSIAIPFIVWVYKRRKNKNEKEDEKNT